VLQDAFGREGGLAPSLRRLGPKDVRRELDALGEPAPLELTGKDGGAARSVPRACYHRLVDASRPSRCAHGSPFAVAQDLLVRASFEVDWSLLRWSLGLSLRERMRAATRVARMLGRFRRAGSPARG
jgi:hypothetical protein